MFILLYNYFSYGNGMLKLCIIEVKGKRREELFPPNKLADREGFEN